MMRGLLAGLLLATAWFAVAADLRSIDVQYEDGRYEMVSVAWFDAGLDETYEVLSNWDYSIRFSGAIVEARNTETDNGPGYYVVNRGCVWFFCKSLVREGYVERQHNRLLRATVDPERSDFRLADEVWEFSEADGGTVVAYRLTMEPAFWVPPAIGPYLIKRKLRNDGGDAINRIEEIARQVAMSDHIIH
jgi:hypothetical protein